jgi:hypothetical protein
MQRIEQQANTAAADAACTTLELSALAVSLPADEGAIAND